MSNEVVIALIGFASAVVGAIFGYLGNSRKQAVINAQREKEQAVINAQREQEQQDHFAKIERWMARVDKKLDEHNGYAEKFAAASKDIALIQKDIKYLTNRN